MDWNGETSCVVVVVIVVLWPYFINTLLIFLDHFVYLSIFISFRMFIFPSLFHSLLLHFNLLHNALIFLCH